MVAFADFQKVFIYVKGGLALHVMFVSSEHIFGRTKPNKPNPSEVW